MMDIVYYFLLGRYKILKRCQRFYNYLNDVDFLEPPQDPLKEERVAY